MQKNEQQTYSSAVLLDGQAFPRAAAFMAAGTGEAALVEGLASPVGAQSIAPEGLSGTSGAFSISGDPKKALAKIQSDLARRNWGNANEWLRALEQRPNFLPEEMCRQVVASAAAKGSRAWVDSGEQKDFFDKVEQSEFWSRVLIGWIRRKDGELPMGQSCEMLRYLSRAMRDVPAEEQAQIWFRTALTGAKMASPGPVWATLREVGPEGGFSEGQKRAILKSWVHGAMIAPLLAAKAHFPATLNAMESLGLAHEAGYLNQITAVMKDLPPPSDKADKREASAAFVAQELIERIPEQKTQEAGVRAKYWLELAQWRAQANETNWHAWTPVEKAIKEQIKKAQALAFPPIAVGRLATLRANAARAKDSAPADEPRQAKPAAAPATQNSAPRRFGR